MAKCPLSDHDNVLGYFSRAVWHYQVPLQRGPQGCSWLLRSPGCESVTRGGPFGGSDKVAQPSLGPPHVKHHGAAWGHERATSGKVHLSVFFFFQDLLWFPSFAALQSSHTEIPVSTSTHPWLIFQSNLLVQLSPPSHTYAKVFYCFLLAAFSQLLPIGTELHNEGGYEIFRISAGLMFSTSVTYRVKMIFLI